MNVNIQPKSQYLINAFLVFFIVHSMQVGVGVQGFQRIIYLESKHDAWISVLIAGIATNIIGFLIYKTLAMYNTSDIFGIHFDLYGKWIGNLINFIYILHCLGAFYVIIRNYIEVVQAWVFPDLPTWFISLTIMILVVYGVTGGFRTIIGVCFFSIIFTIWLILLLAFPFQFANWDYLFPIFESDVNDLLHGARQMTFTILGFELLYAFFPFVKEKEKIHKYYQLGLLFTTLLYTLIMVVSLSYFSGGQLERTIWGTLSMFKIVRLPFIERFEYVSITIWVIIILPNLMLYLWAASRGLGRIFKRDTRKFSLLLALLLYISTQIFLTRVGINLINDQYAKYAFYFVFCYPVILFLLVLIKKRLWKKR